MKNRMHHLIYQGGNFCACEDGYAGDGIICFDIDECQNDSHNCSDNASCLNTQGNFTCQCISGFEGMLSITVKN